MATLSIRMNFDDDFVEFYNSFANNPRGKDYLKLTGIQRDNLDLPHMADSFFGNHIGDISVNPNSSVGDNKNHVTYSHEIVNAWYKLMGFYRLWQQMKEDWGLEEANDLLTKVIIGTFYVHDATKILIPYCFAASTSLLMTEGRPYGPLHSFPPKRLRSFVGQVTEYTMDLSQEFAGAIALGDFLVNVAWFSAKEKLDDKQIENELQSYVHVMLNPFRIGGDPVFSNISIFDEPNIKNLFAEYTYPDGTKPTDRKYLNEINRVQRIFLEFMAKKDPTTGLPYRFPITTLNMFVENGEVVDEEFLDMVSTINKEGLFNVYITDDKAKLASCCRLQSNITDLMKFKGIDSFGNGGLNVGSHRVVTLNFYRICRRFKGDTNGAFMKYLSDYLDKIAKILRSHRNLLKKVEAAGFLKFSNLKWINLDQMFFSSVGIIGIWEGFQELGINIMEEEGLTKAQEYFTIIQDKLTKLSNKYKMPINLEQIPGETASTTMARKDRFYFNDDIAEHHLYANQFIPLWEKADLWERAKVDGSLDKYFSGGLISHLNISDKVTKAQMRKLIKFAIECGLSHFALNPIYTRCLKCDSTVLGKHGSCPECNSRKVDHCTRIVGYFTSVSAWNKERREVEFPQRQWEQL
jgi:ribonucleoside-triphosphate reductase